MAEKMTDRQRFEIVRKVMIDSHPDIAEWALHKMDQLDERYAKQKARKAEKAASDPMKDAILSIVLGAGENGILIEDIVPALDPEFEATKAKVSARLTKLVNAGLVTKEPVKIDKRRLNVYFGVVEG